MTENTFDTYCRDDLPESIKSQLPKDNWWDRIFNLFILAKRPLTIDELLVGYYRQYGVVYNKQTLANNIWQLTKRHGGRVEKIKGKKGLYKLKEKTND